MAQNESGVDLSSLPASVRVREQRGAVIPASLQQLFASEHNHHHQQQLDDASRLLNERKSFCENLFYECCKYKKKADAVARIQRGDGRGLESGVLREVVGRNADLRQQVRALTLKVQQTQAENRQTGSKIQQHREEISKLMDKEVCFFKIPVRMLIKV